MTDKPNTLDHVRRIEDFEERLTYVLGLDDSLFDDLETFRNEEHEFVPGLESHFRFKDTEQDYAAIVVGAKLPHIQTGKGEDIAGYEGMVFQHCKGINSAKDHMVGIIAAQSVGEPLDIAALLQPGSFQREIRYMIKVFKKMGLPELSDQVSVYLDSCYF